MKPAAPRTPGAAHGLLALAQESLENLWKHGMSRAHPEDTAYGGSCRHRVSFRGRIPPLLSQSGARSSRMLDSQLLRGEHPASEEPGTPRSVEELSSPCAHHAAEALPSLPSCPHLLELLDLLLQLRLPRPAVVLLEPHAAAPASPLLSFQLEELQVLELLPEVLNELRHKGRGQLSAASSAGPTSRVGCSFCDTGAVSPLQLPPECCSRANRLPGGTQLPLRALQQETELLQQLPPAATGSAVNPHLTRALSATPKCPQFPL